MDLHDPYRPGFLEDTRGAQEDIHLKPFDVELHQPRRWEIDQQAVQRDHITLGWAAVPQAGLTRMADQAPKWHTPRRSSASQSERPDTLSVVRPQVSQQPVKVWRIGF
jgi:hypothetical protein